MKKNIVILATALLVLNRTEAEETNTNHKPFSATISVAIANQYLNFGTGDVLSKDHVIQSGLYLTHAKSGVSLEFWGSRSLENNWRGDNLANEDDLGVSWNGTKKGLTGHLGVTYFNEPRLSAFGAGDIIYTHARLGKDLGKDLTSLTLTLGYENYTTMPESGFQGGHLFSLTAGKSVSFCNEKLNMSTSLGAVYDTGTLGSSTGLFLRGTAGLNWSITKKFTVNVVSVNYYIRKHSDAMVSTGITYSF